MTKTLPCSREVENDMSLKNNAERKILFVPATGERSGIGHLKRCFSLAECFDGNASIYIPENESAYLNAADEFSRQHGKVSLVRVIRQDDVWDIIFLDKRATAREELLFFLLHGTVISIDEGGDGRRFIPCLIDTPLNPLRKIKPNRVAGLLNQGAERKIASPVAFRNTLVTFGGEDSGGLTLLLVNALLELKLFKPEDITLVEGPLFSRKEWPSGVRVIRHPPSTAGLLPDYDLVFTHFGMTCFEALDSGVPVIILDPTSYHKKLSLHYQFPHIGIKKPDIRVLKKLLSNTGALAASAEKNAKRQEGRIPLSDIAASISLSGNAQCPACGKSGNHVIERFESASYFLCKECSLVYSLRFSGSEKEYNKDYFFADYRNQYGKTYLEDFDTIKKQGERRLSIIKAKTGQHKGILLDVGCAFGPFLLAAKEAGFNARGIEISPFACAYVNETLGLECTCASFENMNPDGFKEKKIDVITMWFVIEHFIKSDIILLKTNELLKQGGVFAFSTPAASGVSYRKNRRMFLSKNPPDHYTIWKPKAARKILKRYGFKVISVQNTGHHPERFPFMGSRKKAKGVLFVLFSILSRLFHLGDTFEIYARKYRETSDKHFTFTDRERMNVRGSK